MPFFSDSNPLSGKKLKKKKKREKTDCFL